MSVSFNGQVDRSPYPVTPANPQTSNHSTKTGALGSSGKISQTTPASNLISTPIATHQIPQVDSHFLKFKSDFQKLPAEQQLSLIEIFLNHRYCEIKKNSSGSLPNPLLSEPDLMALHQETHADDLDLNQFATNNHENLQKLKKEINLPDNPFSQRIFSRFLKAQYQQFGTNTFQVNAANIKEFRNRVGESVLGVNQVTEAIQERGLKIAKLLARAFSENPNISKEALQNLIRNSFLSEIQSKFSANGPSGQIYNPNVIAEKMLNGIAAKYHASRHGNTPENASGNGRAAVRSIIQITSVITNVALEVGQKYFSASGMDTRAMVETQRAIDEVSDLRVSIRLKEKMKLITERLIERSMAIDNDPTLSIEQKSEAKARLMQEAEVEFDKLLEQTKKQYGGDQRRFRQVVDEAGGGMRDYTNRRCKEIKGNGDVKKLRSFLTVLDQFNQRIQKKWNIQILSDENIKLARALEFQESLKEAMEEIDQVLQDHGSRGKNWEEIAPEIQDVIHRKLEGMISLARELKIKDLLLAIKRWETRELAKSSEKNQTQTRLYTLQIIQESLKAA